MFFVFFNCFKQTNKKNHSFSQMKIKHKKCKKILTEPFFRPALSSKTERKQFGSEPEQKKRPHFPLRASVKSNLINNSSTKTTKFSLNCSNCIKLHLLTRFSDSTLVQSERVNASKSQQRSSQVRFFFNLMFYFSLFTNVLQIR